MVKKKIKNNPKKEKMFLASETMFPERKIKMGITS